jgi:Rrf2 family iron-sulfur cluster assembly transcriptional regulator
MLTTKGRYAVMALVDMALNSEGKPMTLAGIAERQGITVAYLEQLFSRLRKSELVRSVRGPGGGYLLARPVGEINVAEVIKASDETIKITRCSSQGCSPQGAKCLTHDLWSGLGKSIDDYLSSISLDDVCSGKLKNSFNFGEELIGAGS